MKAAYFYRLVAALLAVLLFGVVVWVLRTLDVIEGTNDVWVYVVAFFAVLGGGSLTKSLPSSLGRAIVRAEREAEVEDQTEEGHQ